MKRKQAARTGTWVALAWLMFSAAAAGDTVYLVGGGKYQGKVRFEGDMVIVEIPEGSITLDRDSILRIEPGDDLGAQLADKRSRLAPRDAEGHYRLGVWARDNDLVPAARELFLSAIRIQPDHVQAQLALGRVFMDGAWLDPDSFQDNLSRLVAEGLDESALSAGRIALAGLLPQSNRRAVLRMTATAARRTGCFAEAVSLLRELLTMLSSADPDYIRANATIELLNTSPGGLYLIHLSELSRAMEQEVGRWPDRSGFYSLADDDVLGLALRDQASDLIAKGQARLDAAQALQAAEPAKAKTGYSEADGLFGKADAIVADIARSYRVEARRRIIQMHQSSAEASALRFEQVVKTINPGKAAEYKTKLKLALNLLDEVQRELDSIGPLARPYPQEFSVIVAWVQEDLATVRAMRQTLEGELDSLPQR